MYDANITVYLAHYNVMFNIMMSDFVLERICYSRDDLIELASSPLAKEKPECLPAHPIVLENAVCTKE